MSDDVQLWVRTDRGKVYGPLSPTSIELLFENDALPGRVQVSLDGRTYVFPGRMPGVRMVFPKHLWGDQPLPPNELDDAWAKLMSAPVPSLDAATAPVQVVPQPGPVSAAVPQIPLGPVAGPGAVAQAQTRPMNLAQGVRTSLASGVQRLSATLEDSLFGAAGSGQVVSAAPASSAAIAAAMGSQAPPKGSDVFAEDPPFQSSPSSVLVATVEKIPRTGNLTSAPSRRLYFLAASQGLTGLLTCQLSDRVLSIHFRKGSPDSVDSTFPEDTLAAFLVRQRLVSADSLAKAQREMGRFGGELLPAVLGMGLANPGVVVEALAQRTATLLGQLLMSQEGTFTFEERDLAAYKAIPAGNRWQLYCEQLRKIPTAELRVRLREALDLPVMKGSGPVSFTDMKLSPQEVRAFASFDGTKSLHQILASQVPEAEAALRVAYMLAPCELVAFAATVLPAPPAPATAPVVAPVTAPAAAAVSDASAPLAAAVAVAPSVVPERPPSVPVVAGGTPAHAPAPARGGMPLPPGAPGRGGMPLPPGAPSSSAMRPPAVAPGAATSGSSPGMPVPPGVPTSASSASVPQPLSATSGSSPGTLAPGATSGSSPGMAKPAGRAPPTVQPTPRPASQSAVRSSPSAIQAAPRDFPSEVRNIEEVAARMKTQNHFEVLGLTRDAQPNQVKMAYFKLAKDFHPDTVPPGAPEALSKAKEAIFARIGDAHRTLSDDKLRADYLVELETGGAGKIDVSNFLMAEEFFQKGKLFIQARKYQEALRMFEDSLSLVPGDAEPYAWRAYSRFLVAQDKKAILPQVAKDFLECTKRNPNVAQAHYFQGVVYKMLGDLNQAKRFFNQTVKIDPRHVEALRELRLMK